METNKGLSRRQKGFSLIELLIVVGIILVIAAISVINFSRSRIAANESSAVASVKVINTAQIAYSASYPTAGYATNLGQLGPAPTGSAATSTTAGLLDDVLGCPNQPCQKSGYAFTIANATIGNFQVTAVPTSPNNTGTRGFCADQLSTMTYDPNGGTNCTTPLQ